jgi:hypothetical protein
MAEGPLDKVARMLGAKSGAELGAEAKRKAAAEKNAAKDSAATAAAAGTDRSTAAVMQQRQDTMDAAMKELNRQNGK